MGFYSVNEQGLPCAPSFSPLLQTDLIGKIIHLVKGELYRQAFQEHGVHCCRDRRPGTRMGFHSLDEQGFPCALLKLSSPADGSDRQNHPLGERRTVSAGIPRARSPLLSVVETERGFASGTFSGATLAMGANTHRPTDQLYIHNYDENLRPNTSVQQFPHCLQCVF